MKLNLHLVRTVGIASICALFFIGLGSNSNSSAPAGYTGSPADGKTCGTNGGCHGGGTTLDNNMITTDIPSDGYTPGTEYNVTVTVAQAGIVKFGFSFSAQKDDGTELGSLTEGTGTSKNGKYMSHKPTTTSGTDSKSWAFKWTAPAKGTGDVKFYAVGNASDNMSNTTSDKIYNSTATFKEKSGSEDPSSITEVTRSTISIYPNPAQNSTWISIDKPETLTILNLSGKAMKLLEVEAGQTEIDLSDLDYGVYYIVNGDKSIHKTLVRL